MPLVGLANLIKRSVRYSCRNNSEFTSYQYSWVGKVSRIRVCNVILSTCLSEDSINIIHIIRKEDVISEIFD